MDIRSVKLKESYDYNLKYPDGEQSDVVFSLASPQSKEAERVRRKWDTITNKKPPKKRYLTADESAEFGKELVKACIVGWSGLEDGGKELEFSEEALDELVEDENLKWVFNQLAEELTEENNFLSISRK